MFAYLRYTLSIYSSPYIRVYNRRL